MIKYIAISLILSILFLTSVHAEPILGEGCGSKGFYDACNLDCSWSCDSEGQRVKTCYTANGWCEVDNQCTPCDFVKVEEGTECIVEEKPPQTIASYSICEENPTENKDYPLTYYQTKINSECNNGDWITKNKPFASSSGSCTEQLCNKQEWGLDKDGDGYYSLKWTTDIYSAEGVYNETCYPPPAIENSAGLIETQKSAFRTAITDKCEENCFTEQQLWKPITTMKGKEPDCESYDSKCKANDNNAKINLETIYCKDKDGDFYGDNCKPRLQINDLNNYKPLFELKEGYDCNDNNNSINPATMWKEDKDLDGKWGKVIRSCETYPGTKITEMPPIIEFDCDDTNPDKTNPLDDSKDSSGICGCDIEGTTLNGYVCVGPSESIPTGTEVEFKRSNSENKWIKTELKDSTYCPKEMCYNDVISKCVKEGTFWTNIGENIQEANKRGDLYCAKGQNGKGIWTTRTAKIRSMLLEAVEKENTDYTLYCDKFEFITATLGSEYSNYNIKGHLYDLFYDDKDGILGTGCILKTNSGIVVGIPYSGDLTGGGHILNENYTGMGEVSNEGWKEGKNVHLYEPLKIAFIEKNGEGIITKMKGGSIINNFISFLRNPLRILNNNDVSIINNLILKKFDRSYLNKNKKSYWFSMVENNKIYVKVTNQNEDVIKEIEKDCENGKCDVLSKSLIGTVQFENEKLWQDYSRTLRIKGTEGGETFFKTQCNDDNEDTTDNSSEVCTPPPGCFVPTCGALGQCEFKFGGENNKEKFDGCCLPGSTKEDDIDCLADSKYIQLETVVKRNQLCDENDFFLASISDTGEISNTEEYSNKICLHSNEFNVEGTTSLKESCSAEETRVIGIEDSLAFRDDKKSLCATTNEKKLECFTDVSCYGATEVFSISKDSYALSGIPGTYERKTCCYAYDQTLTRPPECNDHLDNDLNGLIDEDDPNCYDTTGYKPSNLERSNALNPTIGLNCPVGKVPIASLSGTTNAHISSNNDYEYKLCVDKREVKTIEGNSCNNELTSITGISNLTNAHAYPPGEGNYQICTEVEGSCSLKTTKECNDIQGEELFSMSSTKKYIPAYTKDTYLIEETINAPELTNLNFTNNGVTTKIYDDSLVFSMNFDNNVNLGESSTLAYDNTGKNNGIITGATWTTEGKYGSALNFDGSNAKVNLPSEQGQYPKNDFTISAWIKPTTIATGVHKNAILDLNFAASDSGNDASTRNGGIFFGITENGPELIYITTSSKFEFSSNVFGQTPINTNKWTQVSATRKGEEVKIYVNGEIDISAQKYGDEISYSSANYDDNSAIIGRSETAGGGTEGLKGLIDEVSMWNRSLTAEEIKFLYNSNLKKIDSTTWELQLNHTITQTEKEGTLDYSIEYTDQTGSNQIDKTIQIAEVTSDELILGNSHVGDVDAYELKVCCGGQESNN